MYHPVDLDEPKISSESDETLLDGLRAAPRRRRAWVRIVWQSVCAVVLLSSYTAMIALLARRTVIEDPTHGGQIIRCGFSFRLLSAPSHTRILTDN